MPAHPPRIVRSAVLAVIPLTLTPLWSATAAPVADTRPESSAQGSRPVVPVTWSKTATQAPSASGSRGTAAASDRAALLGSRSNRTAGSQPRISSAQKQQGFRAGVGAVTSLSLQCPTGMTRVNQYTESFESGQLPETGPATTWSVTSGGAARGSHYATSLVPAGSSLDPESPDGLYLPLLNQGRGRTIVSFAVRGSYEAESAVVALNNDSGVIAPTSEWGQVTLDITDSIPVGEQIDIAFFNLPDGNPTQRDSRIDIDDVEVYRCLPVAATNVAGDFNGDSKPDLLTTDDGGYLRLHPGTGTGTFGLPTRVAARWSGITWMGSIGDVTGDRRPDLLARTTAGYLMLYAGRGMGSFSARTLSRGWNGLNQLTVLGDIDADGLVDLAGRDSRGHLLRYSIGKGGASIRLANDYRGGWDSYARIWSVGDFTGDRKGDLALTRPDGSVLVLPATTKGSFGKAIPAGSFRGLAAYGAAGDLDRQGTGDAWALTKDGALRYYLTAPGRWLRSGVVDTDPAAQAARQSTLRVVMGAS